MTDLARPTAATEAPSAADGGPDGQPGSAEEEREVGGVLGPWWFAICVLTLIIASDYKLRVRDPRDALSGSIDPLIVLELGLYGLVGLYLAMNFAGHPPRLRRTQPHLYLACLFIGLMVLSVAYTAYPQYALVRATQMCILLALVLVSAKHATRADMHRFAHGFIVLVCLSVVYGVVRPSPPVNSLQVGRFTWFAIHPTVSGVLAGLATLLVVGYLVAGKEPRPGPVWPRWFYAGALLLAGGAVLASETRGAVAGTALGIVVVLVSMRGGRALVELQVIGAVLLLGVGLAFGNQIVAYFQRGENSQQLASLNTRTNLWQTAADAIEKKPMFGYGVTSARGIFFNETGLGGGHNAVVNVFVELGLVGLIVWSALVITLVYGIRRLPMQRYPQLRFDRALLLGVITLLMVDGIFFDGPGSTANVASTWFFVCIAWLAVARRSITSDDSRTPETPEIEPPIDQVGRPTHEPESAPLSIDEALQTAKIGRSSTESQGEGSGRHGVYGGSIRPPARGAHPDDPGGGSTG
ncbi:MAG: O-antigen ligase family protein [Acidimicrobiia bacterium]